MEIFFRKAPPAPPPASPNHSSFALPPSGAFLPLLPRLSRPFRRLQKPIPCSTRRQLCRPFLDLRIWLPPNSHLPARPTHPAHVLAAPRGATISPVGRHGRPAIKSWGSAAYPVFASRSSPTRNDGSRHTHQSEGHPSRYLRRFWYVL